MNRYYLFRNNDEKVGPLDIEQLRKAGVDPDTEILVEGSNALQLVAEIGEVRGVLLNDLKRSLKYIKWSLGLSSFWVCLKTIHNKCVDFVGIFTQENQTAIVIVVGYLGTMFIPMLAIISTPFVSIYRHTSIKKKIKKYEEYVQ